MTNPTEVYLRMKILFLPQGYCIVIFHAFKKKKKIAGKQTLQFCPFRKQSEGS